MARASGFNGINESFGSVLVNGVSVMHAGHHAISQAVFKGLTCP